MKRFPQRLPGTASIFLLFAAVLIFQAVRLGGYAWLLILPAYAFLIVALAYAGLGVRLFGKRTDGSMGGKFAVLSTPARWLLHLVWCANNFLTREPPYHLIAPGLYLGRRPGRELPAGVTHVIDMAGELPGSRATRGLRGYRSVGVLDRSTADDETLVSIASDVVHAGDPVLVHCAQGRGRSAEVVAAILIARGVVRDVDDAIQQIRERRPSIRLTRCQRAQLDRLLDRLRVISEARHAPSQATPPAAAV